MKLGTSVALATVLLAICAGGGIFCGLKTYEISREAVGSVSLPEGRPDIPQPEDAPASNGELLSEAAVFDRVNTITNYSSYGPPPAPPQESTTSGS